MVRLRPWQWGILALPIAAIVIFVVVAASVQIHTWGLNWIWAGVMMWLVIWRWLLVRWTRPAIAQIESVMTEIQTELTAATDAIPETLPEAAHQTATQQAEQALEAILQAARNDPPAWENWDSFWQRCREVVVAVAHAYHPEVKYPLLNIYVPDAYQLIRGTVDDMDQWMAQLTPVLGQVTIGQTVEAYEMYRKLEPSARKLWQVWNWAQWVLNPVAAVARTLSQPSSNQANQQLLLNLSQLVREMALRNLYRQSVALYSGQLPPLSPAPGTARDALPTAKTQTLQALLEQAEPLEIVEQKPVNLLLVGRTGAGKSSLINTLFNTDRATVDVLPSTDQIQSYHWQTDDGDSLTLWDSPGYEQVQGKIFREQVLAYARQADLVLLVTPALDPALQMDVDFLQEMRRAVAGLPAIAAVTQVDRLRPLREWAPPYDWQWGDRPKEKAIREATQYRIEQFGEGCDRVLPIVTADVARGRTAWNITALTTLLIEAIDPAKQLRLARFLKQREFRTLEAAKIIDRYTFQMTTTQGLTALLKSPVLQFLSTLTTGTPALAYLLAEQIPVEQLPVVVGKLQLAYSLFQLLEPEQPTLDLWVDLRALWPVLLDNSGPPDRTAWAFGHALVEYWTQGLTVGQFQQRAAYYLAQSAQPPGKSSPT